MTKTPITAAIVGAGHQAVSYASYALRHPDKLRITAIAEPNPLRRQRQGDRFGIAESLRFQSFEELVARPPVADSVINGTMDQLHYSSSLPLLEAGYHMLLEKPIASTEAEVRGLIDAARRHKRIVLICHVLRYAPFYRRIKDLLDSGAIGSIIALTTTESINYHHMTTPFVRGRWRQNSTNPILLAKCCHDLDIIAWLMSGVPVRRQRALDGERLGQLRLGARLPGPVRRVCLPEMHLRIDDGALGGGLRPRLVRTSRHCCTGRQRRAEFASGHHDGPPVPASWSWDGFHSLARHGRACPGHDAYGRSVPS